MTETIPSANHDLIKALRQTIVLSDTPEADLSEPFWNTLLDEMDPYYDTAVDLINKWEIQHRLGYGKLYYGLDKEQIKSLMEKICLRLEEVKPIDDILPEWTWPQRPLTLTEKTLHYFLLFIFAVPGFLCLFLFGTISIYNGAAGLVGGLSGVMLGLILLAIAAANWFRLKKGSRDLK